MCLLGIVVGAGLGFSLSIIIMILLTMISTDEVMNLYFGICFGMLGIMMLAVSQALPFKSKRERADEGSMQDREQRKVQVQATHRRLVRVFDARGDEGGVNTAGGGGSDLVAGSATLSPRTGGGGRAP